MGRHLGFATCLHASMLDVHPQGSNFLSGWPSWREFRRGVAVSHSGGVLNAGADYCLTGP